ncbi:hypothetical protein MtrunA17_Chr4g0067261 [Medicago truncatula]|uniref:Uncharacterized protein n=1 Tax=Medicago truncatula TaxID=3880 RepID=A0A396IIW3_MEDTR|nr:hypothetical protein MtrunA17_Chr4g0067261 [Medicago truncatula]
MKYHIYPQSKVHQECSGNQSSSHSYSNITLLCRFLIRICLLSRVPRNRFVEDNRNCFVAGNHKRFVAGNHIPFAAGNRNPFEAVDDTVEAEGTHIRQDIAVEEIDLRRCEAQMWTPPPEKDNL